MKERKAQITEISFLPKNNPSSLGLPFLDKRTRRKHVDRRIGLKQASPNSLNNMGDQEQKK